jgi:hypothetical protein
LDQQAIAAFWKGLDESPALGFAKRTSKSADRGRNRVVTDCAAVPDTGNKFLLADNASLGLNEQHQQVHQLGLQPEFLAIAYDHSPPGIDGQRAERK